MSTPTYGLLCPMGHGVLNDRDEWTSKGVAWCPHEEHGGNGRFYRLTEVKTGSYNPNAARVKSEWQIEREAAQVARDQARKEREMAKKEPAPKAEKAPRTRKVKEPKECTCGCGGMTKGGRFLPGHDARYHSALAKAEAAKAAAEEATAEPETF